VAGVEAGRIWARDNLLAWGVVPFDAKQRAPEERAQMLAKLGFRSFGFNWREQHIAILDAELEALKRHGIELLACALYGTENPYIDRILEACKRHQVHPQLWLMLGMPKAPEEWARLLPNGLHLPSTPEERAKLSPQAKQAIDIELTRVWQADLTRTPAEQQRRIEVEANRVYALVKRTSAYGLQVELYNHNGWFGMLENQLAVIARLKELGGSDVGVVYNFSHARDWLHDDSRDFLELWRKIKKHVVAVNITGMCMDGEFVYPSQGDSELEMMRTIQDSGWTGPVGVLAEKGDDAEVTLSRYLIGLDWLAAELKKHGSGGPRPFQQAPLSAFL